MTILRFALAVALAAAPAFAAPRPSDLSVKDTRKLMYDYGKCVVAKRPALAAEAILTGVDNAAILTRNRALIDGSCLAQQVIGTSKMRFTGDLYRYALADALVAREFATVAAPDFSSAPRLAHRVVGDPPLPLAANAKKSARRKYDAALAAYNDRVAYLFLANFGECIVRVDSGGAKALLDVRPEAVGEKERFAALLPAMQRCMPEGQTMELGKVALRGTIAVNYYRFARAAAATAR